MDKMIRVNSCDDCPNGTGWDECGDRVLCEHVNFPKGRVNKNALVIPKWCPLEDAPKKVTEVETIKSRRKIAKDLNILIRGAGLVKDLLPPSINMNYKIDCRR